MTTSRARRIGDELTVTAAVGGLSVVIDFGEGTMDLDRAQALSLAIGLGYCLEATPDDDMFAGDDVDVELGDRDGGVLVTAQDVTLSLNRGEALALLTAVAYLLGGGR